jgi:hypothetical protein
MATAHLPSRPHGDGQRPPVNGVVPEIRARRRPAEHDVGVVLMAVVGVVLVLGVALTLWWGGLDYVPWPPLSGDDVESESAQRVVVTPPVRTVTLRYLRGVAIAMVGGFWVGAIVTGPAIRLIMRLLAVTAGDDAQGRLTEAEEIVGDIDVGGTISLIVFGGILTGLLSAAIYVLARSWLPRGRLGGLIFGALHLVVAATVIDPLRPENRDFDIVGPGWLSVTTFGLACVLHGMAVMAFVNRYSHVLLPGPAISEMSYPVLLPLVLPALFLIPFFFVLIPLAIGLGVTVAVSRFDRVTQVVQSRPTLIAGRVAIGVLALALLPRTVRDLHDVIVRDEAAASTQTTHARPHSDERGDSRVH